MHVCTHTHILFNSLHAEKFNEAFQWNGYFHVGTPGELGNIDVIYLFIYDFLEERHVLRNAVRWFYHGGLNVLHIVQCFLAQTSKKLRSGLCVA